VTRSADVQEAFSQNDVFQVTYGEKMMVIADEQNFFLECRIRRNTSATWLIWVQSFAARTSRR